MKIYPEISNVQYHEYGSGDNIIILIHGFLASPDYWNKITPALVKAKYRVISINLLGFGNADKPANIEYGYDDQVEYIRKILDHFKHPRKINIVGHSMGAAIAARYTKLYGKNVRSLVLIHPPLYRDSYEARTTIMSTGKIYRYLLESRYRDLGWRLMRLSLPHVIASHTRHSRELSLKNIILKAEVIKDLKDIDVNTLLLVGLKDRAVYQDNLPSIVSNSNILVVNENVDHHSPTKNPLLIQKYILNFINKSSRFVR